MNDRQEDGHGDSCARPSRRDFLTRAGWLAGGMALMGVQGFRPQWAAAAVDARSFAATSALELDGQFIDFLKSAEGGFPRADVIQQPVGPNGFIKKQIGPPRYQDISIQCSPVLPKPLFDWIAATVSLSYPRKSGAIITGDFNRVEQNRLQFSNALLTEITIPACDGASKEAGYITLKWAPEFTAPLPGKGAAISAPPKNQQKAWLPSNFRLTIPGLDCSKVGKIDALTIKQSVSDGSMGAMREKQPAKLEFPNLVITLAEFSAGTFYAWFQEMVVKGNAGEEHEKAGTLEFLDPTLKNTLLTINFQHLGIFGFAPEKHEANAEPIKRVKVEMYCEQMTFTPGKG